MLAREEKFDPQLDRNRKRFRELRDKPEEKLTPEEKEELADDPLDIPQAVRATAPRGVERRTRAVAMRQETEKVFDYIIREDRSLLELLDSDYTFLNERLAKHYGITNGSPATKCAS